eukprot:5252492-Heterocapsa_arctica.AAC.1
MRREQQTHIRLQLQQQQPNIHVYVTGQHQEPAGSLKFRAGVCGSAVIKSHVDTGPSSGSAYMLEKHPEV